MPANYHKTSRFYDRLSKMVFGNTLNRAQAYFFNYISAGARILIIGGGTGRILEDIAAIYSSGLQITFVEIAAGMIERARKRDAAGNKIQFINSAIEEIDLPAEFDVIITAFLLDNYTEQQLPVTMAHITTQLKPGGLWLNTDFQLTGKWWQPLLMKTMYRFFKLFADIKNSRLPGITKAFESHGYRLRDNKNFYGDFIGAQVWHKPTAKI